MRGEPVRFPAGSVELEGRWFPGDSRRGAVVCHPHPLYGGSMDNNVVFAVAEGFQDAGWGVLLFNFRGVGSSTGTFDRGKGEREDVAAAWEFMKSRGCGEAVLAGYSFGAWVAARSAEMVQPAALLLVSPPLAFWDFHELDGLSIPLYVIGAREDEFCPSDRLEAFLRSLPSETASLVLEGANHFYGGAEPRIRSAVRRWFA